MIYRFPYHLPRNAFSHRDAARAGDVWRAFQDIAVGAATRAGWPPGRFQETGTTFVVREMTVVHHREACFGEALEGSSWVRRFRRETLCTREVRLTAESGPIASGTQEWVHVGRDGKPARAPREMADLFALTEEGGVALPDVLRSATASPALRFELEPWHTWMDPLNHVNHPAYVDFCDEAIARIVAASGLDPADLVPIAESVTFMSPVVAREDVVVTSALVGRTAEGDAVFDHVIGTRDGSTRARATTARRLIGHDQCGLLDAVASAGASPRGAKSS
jgi:acyl-CoA thioesterase FadM